MPLFSIIAPPVVPSLPSSFVLPAVKLKSPPLPLLPSPTLNVILPPLPPVDIPLVNVIVPV